MLTLFGLPVAQDMEGRVLVEAFQEPPTLHFIPSWEEVPGNAGMHTGETDLPPEESAALLEQFIALGYIDRPDQNREQRRGRLPDGTELEFIPGLSRNRSLCRSA